MWVDGYWQGKTVNGYPSSYFDNGKLEYPWEKDIKPIEPTKTEVIIVKE